MNKVQLAAAAAFENHPSVDQVYVTEDGNAFLPEVKNLAIDHARRCNLPAPLLVSRKTAESGQRLVDAIAEAAKEKVVATLGEAMDNATLDLGDASTPEEVATEEAAPEEAAPEKAAPVARKGKKKGK